MFGQFGLMWQRGFVAAKEDRIGARAKTLNLRQTVAAKVVCHGQIE